MKNHRRDEMFISYFKQVLTFLALHYDKTQEQAIIFALANQKQDDNSKNLFETYHEFS